MTAVENTRLLLLVDFSVLDYAAVGRSLKRGKLSSLGDDRG